MEQERSVRLPGTNEQDILDEDDPLQNWLMYQRNDSGIQSVRTSIESADAPPNSPLQKLPSATNLSPEQKQKEKHNITLSSIALDDSVMLPRAKITSSSVENLIEEAEEDDENVDHEAAAREFRRLARKKKKKQEKGATIIDCEDFDRNLLSKGEESTMTLSRPNSATEVEMSTTRRTSKFDVGSRSSLYSRSKTTMQKKQEDAAAKNQSSLAKFMHSNFVTWFMALLTVWALFGSDIRLMAFPKSDDLALAWVMFGVMVCFILEFVGFLLVDPRYRFSFFFWMDLLAIVSLIPDITPIFGSMEGQQTSSLTLARTGRAARAAARTARLSRVVKFFELYFVKRKAKKATEKHRWLSDTNNADTAITPVGMNKDESRVNQMTERLVEGSILGQKVLDTMFKKLFFIVLLMFVVFTLLDPVNVPDDEVRYARVSMQELQNIRNMANFTANTGVMSAFQVAFNTFIVGNGDVVSLTLSGTPQSVPTTVFQDQLREEEKLVVECGSGCEGLFNIKARSQEAAARGLGMTIFVIVLLIFGSAFIHGDINRDIVVPIERMVATLRLLAKNPLATIPIKEDYSLETGMVEAMLSKLAVLLQMSFGAAGASMISQNLMSAGSLVPMVPGTEIEGVFGVVEIVRFQKLAEELKGEIIVVLNMLAQLVHFVSAQNGGFPYRNSDGKFAIMFPVPTGRRRRADKSEETRRLSLLAGRAMNAFVTIRHALMESPDFKAVVEDITSDIEVTFALHHGTAIAGAIGSSMKVEATFMSSDVSYTRTIARTSMSYGLYFMMTEKFYKLLSEDMKQYCIWVDKVRLPGSSKSDTLYTLIECVTENIPDEHDRRIFVSEFEHGRNDYISGRWFDARSRLENAETVRGTRLVKFILQYLSRTNDRAPPFWKGYRDFEEDSHSASVPTPVSQEHRRAETYTRMLMDLE